MKNRVEVVIAGNRFTMTGEQDEEYMTKIATLVDNRVSKIRESGANLMQALTLAACDMADNYVQAVQGAENLRKQISSYLVDNKTLTQDLADAQEEIRALEPRAADRAAELEAVDQLKSRIGELEQQVAASAADRDSLAGLEDKLREAEAQVEAARQDAEARVRAAKDEADAQAAASRQDAEARVQSVQAEVAARVEAAKAQVEADLRAAQEQAEVRVQEAEASARAAQEEAESRVQTAQNVAAARTRRIEQLEEQLVDADKRHQADLAQAERTERELREMREKAADCDEMRDRIEQLERDLASTEGQLNDLRTRLARLLK